MLTSAPKQRELALDDVVGVAIGLVQQLRHAGQHLAHRASRQSPPLLVQEILGGPIRQDDAALGIGADDGFDLATPLPIVPAANEPLVSAEEAVLDRASGRFSATLVLDSGEGAPVRLRVLDRAWSGVAAAVPVMVLYYLAQRFMVQGLATGGVKG